MSLRDAVKLLAEQGVSSAPSILKVDEAIEKVSDKREESSEEPKNKIEETSSGGEEFAVTYPEGWDDDTLKEFFVATKRISRDARAYKQSIRDEVWDLYNNLQDFSQKADWQMKEARPKVFMMVESVVAFFQLGLFKLRDWFDVFPVNSRNPVNKVKAFIVKQILKFYTTQQEFIDELLYAIKWSFLSELAIMKVWEGEEVKYTVEPIFLDNTRIINQSQDEKLPTIHQKILRRRKIMYKAVDPANFYLDPNNTNKYVIEEGTMDISTLQELTDSGLVEDHVDDIVNDTTGQTVHDIKRERRAEQVTTPPSVYFKRFTYHEFWGDVVDNKGKSVFKNIHFMIAGEKWILIKPEPIKFFDGEHPYVFAPCIYVPGSVYHKSLIEPVAGLAKQMTELINLTFDAIFATVLNVFEIDIDRVQNIDDLANGIGPNTVIQKTGPDKVLEVTQVGKVPGEAFSGIQFLDSILEQDTAISKLMIGVPTTAKRQTKGEVQQQAQFTSSFFQALVQNIENKFIAKVLKKIWYRVLQFPHELSHPKLADMIGEEAASLLSKMTAQERYETINGDYEIRVTGLSGLLAKQQELSNIFTFLRVSARSPNIMSILDPLKLAYEILELLNIDPVKITRDQPVQPLNARGGSQGQVSTQSQTPGQQKVANGAGQMNLQQLMQMVERVKQGALAQQTNTIAEG